MPLSNPESRPDRKSDTAHPNLKSYDLWRIIRTFPPSAVEEYGERDGRNVKTEFVQALRKEKGREIGDLAATARSAMRASRVACTLAERSVRGSSF